MKNDTFGDRMKAYERENVTRVEFAEDDPVDAQRFLYLRLDGRSFSNFTRKLKHSGNLIRPRDGNFENVFVEAVKDTVKEFSLVLGFHQSDEISLWFKPVVNPASGSLSQLPFDGNLAKINSVVASYFTNRFTFHFHEHFGFIPEVSFDCRSVVFKEQAEAVNMLVWRWQDATRNVIQDYAFHMFGHKKLDKVSTSEKLAKIMTIHKDFYEDVLKKYGNFIKRETFDMFVSGRVNEEDTTVIRSRVVKQRGIEFQNLTFDQRVELVYGSIHRN